MVALLTREVVRVLFHTVMSREFPHYAVQNMLRAMLPSSTPMYDPQKNMRNKFKVKASVYIIEVYNLKN